MSMSPILRLIIYNVITFLSDFGQVGGFLRFPPPIKLPNTTNPVVLKPSRDSTTYSYRYRYNWNIVESGVKHHKPIKPTFIPPFDFHFRIYKRDHAILTEWWQQRIAWWGLINAVCQIIWSIICIRKQHSNHMEDDTFKRILQDKQSIYRSKQSRRK